jgi:hypothetical protein
MPARAGHQVAHATRPRSSSSLRRRAMRRGREGEEICAGARERGGGGSSVPCFPPFCFPFPPLFNCLFLFFFTARTASGGFGSRVVFGWGGLTCPFEFPSSLPGRNPWAGRIDDVWFSFTLGFLYFRCVCSVSGTSVFSLCDVKE